VDKEQRGLLEHVIHYLSLIAGDCNGATDIWNKARVTACWQMLGDLMVSMAPINKDAQDA
jgi:hypothetical protein